MIKSAVSHFLEFHKGGVNIAAHVIGFAGIFYSIYMMEWLLFALFLIVLEFGHLYNHSVGIKQYDFRPKVIFGRATLFIVVVLLLFLIT
jgi:hypothetical protein